MLIAATILAGLAAGDYANSYTLSKSFHTVFMIEIGS